MFTGIIEEVGTVQSLTRGRDGATLEVRADRVLEDLKVGDSLAVNGVCLTLTHLGAGTFSADLSPETLRVTNLGALQKDGGVNLERPLRLSDRLGGHLVLGHVDGVGKVRARRQQGDALILAIEVPKELEPYCVPKGSIAVDGVSLTINTVPGSTFEVVLIPHTVQATTLGTRHPGARVNIETDIIGKYVARLLPGR